MKKKNKFVVGIAAAAAFASIGALAGCGDEKTYTVTFVGASVAPMTVKWGELVTQPETPTKAGYTFAGWYVDEKCTTAFDFDTTQVETAISIYAKWVKASYTITFDCGEGVDNFTFTGVYESSVSVENPTKPNYKFDKWYTDPECTIEFNLKVPNKDTTVYANWIANQLVVNFDKNSEEAEGSMQTQVFSEENASKVLSKNTFTREGYTFKGWALEPNGEVAYQNEHDFEHIPEEGTITLYAVWEVNHYSISFFEVKQSSMSLLEEIPADYGTKHVLSEKKPELVGHNFVGWGDLVLSEDTVAQETKTYYQKDGSNISLASALPGDAISGLYEVKLVENVGERTISGNTSYYPVFERAQFSVTIMDEVTGQPASDPVLVYYGSSFTVPEQPAKEGYTSRGYFLSTDDSKPVSSSILIGSETVIYSRYSIHSHTFKIVGLPNEVSSTKEFGALIDLATLEQDKDGYTFEGFYYEPTFETLAEGTFEMGDEDVTLYAKYTINKHYVYFNSNEGSDIDPIELEYNQLISINSAPTREGYTFLRWELDGAELTGEERMPDADVTLEAVWEINDYEIIFDENGGSAVENIAVTFGNSLESVSLPVPTKTGYTFKCWKHGEYTVTAEYLKNFVMGAEDVTFVAEYEINKHSVILHSGTESTTIADVEYGTDLKSILAENKFTVEGHHFSGWFKNEELTEAVGESVKLGDADAHFYQKSDINTYGVSFVVEGSTIKTESAVEHGSLLSSILPTEPTKTGYHFLGWYVEDTKVDPTKFGVTGDLEVVGKFEVNKVSITVKHLTEKLDGSFVEYDNETISNIDAFSKYELPSEKIKVIEGFAHQEHNNIDRVAHDGSSVIEVKYARKSYQVKFVDEDGKELESATVKYGATPEKFSSTLEKHTTHFYVNDVEKQLSEIVVSGDTEVVVKYVEFPGLILINEGSTVAELSELEGTTIDLTQYALTKEGYTFDGYYTAATGGEKVDNSYVMPAGGATLYARFIVNQYKLVLDKANGEEKVTITQDFGSDLSLLTPTKEGFVFTGWYVGDEKFNLTKMPVTEEAGLELTAHYAEKYINVSFDANGGVGSMAIEKVMYSDYGSYSPTNAFTKVGHSFVGFTSVKDGEVIEDFESFLLNSTTNEVASSVTLYAKWSVNSYTVSFDTKVSGMTYQGFTANYGEDISSKEVTPEREGYTFNGWYLKDTSTKFDFSKPMGAANVELEAHWTVNSYKIIFNSNGGTSVFDVEGGHEYGSSLEGYLLQTPTKTGKVFDGWYTKDGSGDDWGEKVDATYLASMTMPASEVTFYAKWRNPIITFDTNGGSNVSSITCDAGTKLDAPAAPEKLGYTFAGWYTDASLSSSSRYYFNAMDGKDVQLYAKWIANKYSVIFNSMGGSTVVDTTAEGHEHLSTLEGYTLPANPTRDGYNFAGWYALDENGQEIRISYLNSQGELVVDSNALAGLQFNADDITLFAKWEPKQYTVNYYVNGSIWYSEKVAMSEEIRRPEDPVDGSKAFYGWYQEVKDESEEGKTTFKLFDFSSLMEALDSEDPSKVSLDLIAKFNEDPFKIIFVDENNVPIYITLSNAEDPTFNAYIKELLGEMDGYQRILEALHLAVEHETPGSTTGSLREFLEVAAYATLRDNLDLNSLYVFSMASQKVSQDNAISVITTMGTYEYVTGGSNELHQLIVGAISELSSGVPGVNVSTIMSKASQNEAFAAVATAIGQASAGDQTMFKAFGAYATFHEMGFSQERIDELKSYLGATLSSEDSDEFFTNLAMLAADNNVLEILDVTSQKLIDINNLYQAYEDNLYKPFSSDPNKYFDGWTITSDNTQLIQTYTPKFVSPEKPVSDINVYEKTSSSVKFKWDAVENAYGYKVVVTDDLGNVIANEIVTDNEYKVNKLRNGDTIKISVIALTKDANGGYREKVIFDDVQSLKDHDYITGDPIEIVTLHKDPISLDSEAKEISYFHTNDNEIGTVSKKGDFYYITEDGLTKKFFCFTNATYGFGNKEVSISGVSADCDTVVGKNAAGDNALITGNNPGTFSMKVGDTIYEGHVLPVPSNATLGKAFGKYSRTTFTTNTHDIKEANTKDFIAAETTAETFKIGKAIIANKMIAGTTYGDYVAPNNKTVVYQNGAKLDLDVLSTTGKVINIDREYKFYDENNLPLNFNDVAEYDKDNNVFYFKKTGKFTVEVSPKADSGEYVNVYVPDKYKNESDQAKLNRLTTRFSFEVVEGINIYTSAGLNKVLKDKDLTTSEHKLGILIQNDIKVEVPARSLVYVEHIEKTDLKDRYLGGPQNITKGDADIVDGTAVMTTNDNAFRKIWVVNNENPLFHDIKGVGYSYSDAGGTHAIDSAQFIQNFDDGLFKLNNDANSFGVTDTLNDYGLETMHIFARSGSYQTNDVEINGNYFTLDASKVPLTHSRSLNGVAGFEKYKIQNISNSIINNATPNAMVCKNINMVGNTSNVSAAIGSGEGGEQTSIERQMMLTSGGLNGFRTVTLGKDSNGKYLIASMDVQNCNVSNCLISLYADGGMNINHTHVKNSWANGLYAYVTEPDVEVRVSNSVIEASGGAAIQVDDQEFGKTPAGAGTAITPKAIIDYPSCTVENFVSGAEQYFKGYGMESLAIGLKSMINSGVKGLGMTIVKNVVSPTTGLESECINWVYFTKTEHIKATDTTSDDIETDFMFGEGYRKFTENIDTTSLAGTQLPNALYVDQSHVNSDGTVNGLVLLDAVALSSEGKIAPYYPENAVFDHSKPTEQYVVVSVRIDPSNYSLKSVGQMFFYFGMDQAIGYIQGMVELFKA